MRPLLELFWSFFKIGVFTFGGGYAMIPLIQREVTDRKGWIPAQEFLDLLTVAQSAPGPISLNTSVFVGYKIRGYAGAVASVLGVVVPSFAIILVIAVYFADIRRGRRFPGDAPRRGRPDPRSGVLAGTRNAPGPDARRRSRGAGHLAARPLPHLRHPGGRRRRHPVGTRQHP